MTYLYIGVGLPLDIEVGLGKAHQYLEDVADRCGSVS